VIGRVVRVRLRDVQALRGVLRDLRRLIRYNESGRKMTLGIPRGDDGGTLFGRYRLVRELGRGGMGVVYYAVIEGPQGFSRPCVVKRIVPELAGDAGFIQSLVAEARLSGMLAHPGIVQLYEFGEVDGEYFLAMEYVDGVSLYEAIRRSMRAGSSLPPGVVCYVAAELALALGHAHAMRDPAGRALEIVHRDVSPSNVMLGRSGTVKLLDFGIARAASHTRDHITRTGTLKGKFAYMSPEQAEGLPIDHRSDLFALGTIVWEALTLRRLFFAPDDMQTLRMVREAKVTPTGIDTELDTVLLRLLARDRDERWATGDEVAATLQPIAHRLHGNTFSMRRVVAELGEEPPAETTTTQATQSLVPPRRLTRPMPPVRAPEPAKGKALEPTAGKAGYEVKGSIVRAYTQQIEQLGILAAVLDKVPPEIRRQMEDPPLHNVWLDASVIEEMITAVESVRGIEGVRTVTRLGQELGLMPIMRPVVVGMLRLFGTSPHTILSRFTQFSKNNVRGMAFEWTRDSDRAGTLSIQFPRKNVPHSAYVGFESAMHIICGLCSVKPTVEATKIGGDGSTGLLHVSW
jgi:serine/threonine-protein kinase